MKIIKICFIAFVCWFSQTVFALSGEAYGNINMVINITDCGKFDINTKVIDEVFRRYFKWNSNKKWSYVDELADLRTDRLFAEKGIYTNLGGSYKIDSKKALLLAPNYATRDYYASFVASFADEVCDTDYLYGTPSIKYASNKVVFNKNKTSAKLTSSATIYAFGEKIGTLKETITFKVSKGSFPRLP